MAFTRRGSAEINVTPLIDVLLVLLVIFLIVMPSITTYEEVHTPPSEGEGTADYAALIVRVKPDLSVVLVDEGREIALEAGEVPVALRAHLRQTTHVVYIELDEAVQWGDVVSTIDTIHGIAPSTQVALMAAER